MSISYSWQNNTIKKKKKKEEQCKSSFSQDWQVRKKFLNDKKKQLNISKIKKVLAFVSLVITRVSFNITLSMFPVAARYTKIAWKRSYDVKYKRTNCSKLRNFSCIVKPIQVATNDQWVGLPREMLLRTGFNSCNSIRVANCARYVVTLWHVNLQQKQKRRNSKKKLDLRLSYKFPVKLLI